MAGLFSSSQSKRSLILAGGGVRLAYHAGVLIALEEAGINFDHVDGTSGGIFGTAMLASGITPYEAGIRWRKLNLDGFMSAMPFKDYTNENNLPALGSADGIRKKIFPSLGIDVKKINTNALFKATINVCNFSKKTIECISQENITEDHLIAGMSLPIFMPAVKINNDWYTDAVWIKDANTVEAVKRGAEELWLVWCIGNTHEYLNGSFNEYVHMIEISANSGLYEEIDWLRSNNTDRLQKGLKAIDLHIIKPEYPLPLDPDFLFNKINADTLINMGYADAKDYLVDRKKFGDGEPLYTSTAMTTFDATLHFRQQFKGKYRINDTLSPVTIQLSFFIRQIKDQYIFQQFSSISVDGTALISGYDNIVNVSKGKIETQFQFYINTINYTATIQIQLHSVHDMLFGIDSKMAIVKISTIEAPGDISIFVQPTLYRIKNAFYCNVNATVNWYKKLRLKYTLLSKFFN